MRISTIAATAALLALPAAASAAAGQNAFFNDLLKGAQSALDRAPRLADGPGQALQDKIWKLEDVFVGLSLLELYVAERFEEALDQNLTYFASMNLGETEKKEFREKLAAAKAVQESLVQGGVLKKVRLPPQLGGGEALMFALAGQRPSPEAVAETWRYRAAVNAVLADPAAKRMKAALDKLNAEGPDEEIQKVPHALVEAFVRYDEIHEQVDQLSGAVLKQLGEAVAENGGKFDSRWNLRIAPPKP